MSTENLRFSRATADDLERILEIHLAAYPDPRSLEERQRGFTASPWGGLSDLVIVRRGGEHVGQAFLFLLEGWFGGRATPLGAIASVAVAPEARGQGIASALMEHLHVASDVRGDALTMLYAFRQRFYARFDYGPTSSRRRLRIDPASIPASWRALAQERVRRARGDDQVALRETHLRAAASASGWHTRSDAFWARHLARERRIFLVAERPAHEGGGVAGYVAFEVSQREDHAETTLMVDEIAADDGVTRRALLGALAGMRDQVASVELEVAADDPLELGLTDSDGRRFGTQVVEHSLGSVVGGPMVRIEDVTRAFEARGYADDGAFDVVVGGAHGTSGGEEFAAHVHVEGGRAEVSAARGAATALRTSRATLASLLYGGLRPSDAVRLGLATGDARTLVKADALLAMPPVAPIDPF